MLPWLQNARGSFRQRFLFILGEAVEEVVPLAQLLVLEVRWRLLHGPERGHIQLKKRHNPLTSSISEIKIILESFRRIFLLEKKVSWT